MSAFFFYNYMWTFLQEFQYSVVPRIPTPVPSGCGVHCDTEREGRGEAWVEEK